MTPETGRTQRRDLALLWHQIRYEQLSFWRNPQSAFFTFVFPVVIIVLFGALFHGVGRSSYFYSGPQPCSTTCPRSPRSRCWAPATASSPSCCPPGGKTGSSSGSGPRRCQPGPDFLGLLAHCIVVSVVDIALIVGVGLLFGVPLPTHWAAIALALVLGAACFCALGVAVASLIRNAEAAPAVVQLVCSRWCSSWAPTSRSTRR